MTRDKEPGDQPRQPLRSRFENDPDMRSIVQEFIAEMPARVDDIVDCWERRQFDELRRLAHQLKGAGGGYGFPSLGNAAGELEEAIRSAAEAAQLETDRIKLQFDELVRLCRSVIRERCD